MKSAIQNFNEGIKTEATKRLYEIYLNDFLSHTTTTPNKLIKMKSKMIEELVSDYIVHLKRRVEADDLSPNSINTMVAPIQLFAEQNDIALNWRKLKRMFPRKVAPKNKLPYTTDDIRKMLGATTSLRNKALIHFEASSGVRVGGIELQLKHLVPIEDGCVIHVYPDDIEEYRTCLTPEAYRALKEYFEYRKLQGEKLNPESPVFINFSGLKAMSYDAEKSFMKQILRSAGLRKKGGRKYQRHEKSLNHAFRKRFETVSVMAEMHPKLIDYMMGHKVGQDRSYLTLSDAQLYQKYKKIIPELTIDESLKLKEDVKKKDELIKKKESEKDVIIEEYGTRILNTEKLVLELQKRLDSKN